MLHKDSLQNVVFSIKYAFNRGTASASLSARRTDPLSAEPGAVALDNVRAGGDEAWVRNQLVVLAEPSRSFTEPVNKINFDGSGKLKLRILSRTPILSYG